MNEVESQVAAVDVIVSQLEVGAFQLRIATRTQHAVRSRSLTDDSCASLADAASVIVALALDPSSADRISQALPTAEEASAADKAVEPQPAQSSSPTSSSPPNEAETNQPEPADGASPRDAAPTRTGNASVGTFTLSAAPAWQWGPLPESALGLQLGGGWVSEGERWNVSLMAQVWPAQRFGVASAPDADVTLALWDVGARGGPVWSYGAVRWYWLRMGLEGGVMTASSAGLLEREDSVAPWFATNLSSAARWRLWRSLALFGELGLVIPLLRKRYTIANLGSVHVPAQFGARAALGLQWEWSTL